MNSTENSRRKRLPQLDLLRAVACFLVIVSHSPVQREANSLVRAIHRGGWVGVDLFFVLSGYLVAGLLFDEYLRTGTIRPFRFAARRSMKIYPAFYFYLVATTIAIFFIATDLSNIHFRRIAAEVFFVQNYFPSTWGHTWSLAVEEHFYIALILLIYFLVCRRRTNPFCGLPIAVSVICVTCLFWRLHDDANGSFRAIPHTTHLRIDALSFGVLVSYARHLHPALYIPLVRLFSLSHVVFRLHAAFAIIFIRRQRQSMDYDIRTDHELFGKWLHRGKSRQF